MERHNDPNGECRQWNRHHQILGNGPLGVILQVLDVHPEECLGFVSTCYFGVRQQTYSDEGSWKEYHCQI